MKKNLNRLIVPAVIKGVKSIKSVLSLEFLRIDIKVSGLLDNEINIL